MIDRRRFLASGLQVAAAGALVHPLVRGVLDTVDLGSARSIASVRAPRIITRAQWGADESLKSGSADFAAIHTMFVHHTVTTNDENDPAARIRAIYRNHTQTRGWDDIGYNFLVDQQGRIYEGRSARNGRHDGENSSGEGVVGAHAGGHNTGSVGVALLGTFSNERPSTAAIEGLLQVLSWKADRHGVDPLNRILGHRDVRPTSCPGDDFYAMLSSVRRQTALRIADGFIGYRTVAASGLVSNFGGAADGGDLPSGARGVDVAGVPGRQGYWLLDHLGGVHTRAGASYHGSIPAMRARGVSIGRSRPVAIEGTRSGRGYWVLDEAGGVFTFGDAAYRGSIPQMRRDGHRIGQARVVDIVRTPGGNGYWVLDEAGGVFTFGDAAYRGSVPQMRNDGHRIPRVRVTAMAATASGRGYWVLDERGGVFQFGDAPYHGSLPGIGIHGGAGRAIGLVPTPSGDGYIIATERGSIHTFGRAPYYGRPTSGQITGFAPVIRT